MELQNYGLVDEWRQCCTKAKMTKIFETGFFEQSSYILIKTVRKKACFRA